MKKLLLITFFLLLCTFAKSQDAQVKLIRGRIDSIIQLIRVEKNEDKKVALYLSIYTVSVDGYPVLLLETYQNLYAYSQETKDPLIESCAWSFAGQGYRLSGNYVKALECHYKAVALAEKIGNGLLLAYARNQMAHIYKDREENEKALSLYRLATETDTDKGEDPHAHWWAYMNMGAVYLNMGQLDSSLIFSLKAQDWFPKNNNEASYTYILSNIGSAYGRQGNNEKAKQYLSEALAVAEAYQSPRYINVACMSMAEHFYHLKQFDSSLHYAKRAVDVVNGSVIGNLALKPSKLVANIYQNINADSSLKYWKVYMAANDSLYSIRTNQQLMMMAFDEDRKKEEFDNQQKAYRSKVKTNLMLATICAAALFMLILYRNNRQRKKTNNELQKTLTDLKATQTQLIQSEKMASLGELTAGIAHEIQNPLNFVNNFSEVNKELAEELKEELATGNLQSAQEIAEDLQSNSEKINHHGKRADAIVKGMLQHSQVSKGQKELTDINALADEYLRLAYHGLRAKDKSFNAKLKTDFDETIGKINILPQDIGRVFLNLITNAFYAVGEKSKTLSAAPAPTAVGNRTTDFEPTVSIKTTKSDNRVFVSVSDNGNGIPSSIIDKIFQPFFTTKPTGQGTGLGLSLAYDIVKAHGGELKVNTKENEGSEFIILLPINIA
jgi:two-component system NtrC family sensor kinase